MLQHMLAGPKADALCAAASIIKPIHNVKDVRSKPYYPPDAGSVFFSSWSDATGGAYRDRTDDPLLAKQVLSQLS